MPHDQMQEFVNVDYVKALSIMALAEESDNERIIAEARYEKGEETGFGDVAFAVDERCQGLGIGVYLYELLVRLAEKGGLKGLTAQVLKENEYMMKIFEKWGAPQMQSFWMACIFRKVFYRKLLSQNDI